MLRKSFRSFRYNGFLSLSERMIGNTQTRDRLVAHRVEIYHYNSPSWERIGSYQGGKERGSLVNLKEELYAPNGERNLVVEADLGQELLRLAGKPAYHIEVLEKFAQYELPDGTEIQGRRVKKTLLTSNDIERLNSYLDISFDLMPKQISLPSYGFKVDVQKMSREKPFEALVISYVTFNGQVVNEKKERVVPILKVAGGKEKFELKYRRR